MRYENMMCVCLCLFQIRGLWWGRVQLSFRRWSMWAVSLPWWPTAEEVHTHARVFTLNKILTSFNPRHNFWNNFACWLIVCVVFLPPGFHAPRLVTIENCMKLTQMIVQGLQESKSPLLQLPHFEEEHLRYCISKKVTVECVHTYTDCTWAM